MATGKNAVLIFSNISKDTLFNSSASELDKMRRKGSYAPLHIENDLKTEALAGALEGESIIDAVKAAGFPYGELSSESDFYVTEANTEEELTETLRVAYKLGASKTFIIIATPDVAFFYGLGVERKVKLKEAIPATCIAPTLAWIADLPFPAQVEAAPAYSMIKGLNFKSTEMAKMKKSLNALTLNIERGNLQPWDKHDCA